MDEQIENYAESAQGSIMGLSIAVGTTNPIQPQAAYNKGIADKAASPSCGEPISGTCKAAVSAEKLDSNRRNSLKSTGPRTESGKAKAAANAFKHGFFAKHLFLNPEQLAKDKPEYDTVADGVCEHYRPIGFMENYWAAKIATEAFRLARIIRHESKVLDWPAPFEERSPNNIARYQSAINRQLVDAIEQLDRLQASRKAEATPPGASSPVEQSEKSASKTVSTEICEAGGPPVMTGEPTTHSAQDITVACAQPPADDPLSADSPPNVLNVGTNPPTLADMVTDLLADEEPYTC